MKRNWIFQSKQQLRGFSEGDFIDRGILLWTINQQTVGLEKKDYSLE